MDYSIAAYSAEDTFSSMFTAFTSGFTSVMGFISSNSWILIAVATPVILGLLGAVISFIKSKV